jgi:hypothetical protein
VLQLLLLLLPLLILGGGGALLHGLALGQVDELAGRGGRGGGCRRGGHSRLNCGAGTCAWAWELALLRHGHHIVRGVHTEVKMLLLLPLLWGGGRVSQGGDGEGLLLLLGYFRILFGCVHTGRMWMCVYVCI